MDKALIEKAAREFTKTISREQKESFGDFIVRQTDVYNAFIAGATWQREQSEIQTTSSRNYDFEDWYAEYQLTNKKGECVMCIHSAEAAFKFAISQLIKELREWIETSEKAKYFMAGIELDAVYKKELLAKLDLLEKRGEK